MSTETHAASLSPIGLRAIEAWLEDYSLRIEKKSKDLVYQMVREGVEYAKGSLEHVDTGETLNSIAGSRDGNTGTISVGGASVWIEFGTGVYAPGQTNHPLLGVVAEEGIVEHGEYGWKQGANPNGWLYKGKDGAWHRTKGIPSNPFMYYTAQMLRREYKRIAKEVFK